MEIVYIIVGIFSAVFTFSVGYSVMGVVKIRKQIENVLGYVDSIQRKLDSMESDIHRKIDDDILEVHSSINQVHSRIDYEVKDILSMVDSRLDKLENKIKGMIPPTNDELMKRIQKIEEESYRLRMNL